MPCIDETKFIQPNTLTYEVGVPTMHAHARAHTHTHTHTHMSDSLNALSSSMQDTFGKFTSIIL